jgi:hypothetical protein
MRTDRSGRIDTVEEDAFVVRLEMCCEAVVDDRLRIDLTELNLEPYEGEVCPCLCSAKPKQTDR